MTKIPTLEAKDREASQYPFKEVIHKKQRDQYHAIATELEAKRYLFASDWAETDTHVRDVARKIIGDDLADGSADYVPCISGLVEMIQERITELEAKLERIEEAIRDEDACTKACDKAMEAPEYAKGLLRTWQDMLISVLNKKPEK